MTDIDQGFGLADIKKDGAYRRYSGLSGEPDQPIIDTNSDSRYIEFRASTKEFNTGFSKYENIIAGIVGDINFSMMAIPDCPENDKHEIICEIINRVFPKASGYQESYR